MQFILVVSAKGVIKNSHLKWHSYLCDQRPRVMFTRNAASGLSVKMLPAGCLWSSRRGTLVCFVRRKSHTTALDSDHYSRSRIDVTLSSFSVALSPLPSLIRPARQTGGIMLHILRSCVLEILTLTALHSVIHRAQGAYDGENAAGREAHQRGAKLTRM